MGTPKATPAASTCLLPKLSDTVPPTKAPAVPPSSYNVTARPATRMPAPWRVAKVGKKITKPTLARLRSTITAESHNVERPRARSAASRSPGGWRTVTAGSRRRRR